MRGSMIGVAIGALAVALLALPALGQDGPEAFEFTATPGEVEGTGTLEATDSRASGDLVVGFGEVLFTDPAAHLGSFSVRLTNDGGAWTGTGRVYGGGAEQTVSIWELTGEGAYEGLSLFTFGDAWGDTSWGLIIATDAIPPYPDLPAE
jgi:hypothetical protein